MSRSGAEGCGSPRAWLAAGIGVFETRARSLNQAGRLPVSAGAARAISAAAWAQAGRLGTAGDGSQRQGFAAHLGPASSRVSRVRSRLAWSRQLVTQGLLAARGTFHEVCCQPSWLAY
jgi:hypothetical protein